MNNEFNGLPIRVLRVLDNYNIRSVSELRIAVENDILNTKKVRNYGKWSHNLVIEFLRKAPKEPNEFQCPHCGKTIAVNAAYSKI